MKELVCSWLTKTERLIQLSPPSVTVLAYHGVSNDQTIVDVTPDMFIKQITRLRRDYQFITLDQVVDYINGNITFSKPVVALTFDDAYADLLAVAHVLARWKIPAAVFTLSRPQEANRAELANDKKLLTFDELKALSRIGWTIGSHSATHPNFARNFDLTTEIVDSKHHLEEILGTSIDYFCYPKGIYNKKIVNCVSAAGYKAAFAFEPGFISQKTDMFTIPRMGVDWTHTENQFEAFFTRWGVRYLQGKQTLASPFYHA